MGAIMETAVAETRSDILANARESRRAGSRNSIVTIENAAWFKATLHFSRPRDTMLAS